MTGNGNDLVKLTQDELSELLSFDDAAKYLAGKGYDVTTVNDYLSDGFEEVDKKDLINRPFIIVMAKVAISKDFFDDEGDPAKYAVLKVITQDGKRFRFSDGSLKSGIANQVMILEARRNGGAVGAIMAKGLAVSEYEYADEKGIKSKARTYYFGTE